jgi:hypothetical protein
MKLGYWYSMISGCCNHVKVLTQVADEGTASNMEGRGYIE